jgi:hypothetical protein
MSTLRCPAFCAVVSFARMPAARVLAAFRIGLSLLGGVLCILSAVAPWAVYYRRNWPYVSNTRITRTLYEVCYEYLGTSCEAERGAGVQAGAALLAAGGALGAACAVDGFIRELVLRRLRHMPSWSARLGASTRGVARARAAAAAAAVAGAAAGLSLAAAAPSTHLPPASPNFGAFISTLTFEETGRGFPLAVAGTAALLVALTAGALAECGAPTLRPQPGQPLPRAADVRAEFRAAVAGEAAKNAAAAAEWCGLWGTRWGRAAAGAGVRAATHAAGSPAHAPNREFDF